MFTNSPDPTNLEIPISAIIPFLAIMHQRKDLRTILPFQIYGAQFKMTFFLILFITSQTKQKNEKGTARFFTSLVCLTLSVRFTTYRFLRSEVFKIASDVKTKCSSSHRIVHALVRFIIHFKYVRDSLCELCVFVVVVVVVSRRRLSFSPVFCLHILLTFRCTFSGQSIQMI